MDGSEAHEVTLLLQAWRSGDENALNRLFPVVYDELRRMAAVHLAAERINHTLQPTALVNEVYLRLVDFDRVKWRSRARPLTVREIGGLLPWVGRPSVIRNMLSGGGVISLIT